MLDTYEVFDTVEAWQVEVGDPVILDGEHVIVTGISEDDDQIFLTGISEETGDETSSSLYWSKDVDLWRISDE